MVHTLGLKVMQVKGTLGVMLARSYLKIYSAYKNQIRTCSTNTPGSGVGKGGGGGGTVRESGGSLGQYGAAQEEGYFHKKQREQLEEMKKKAKKDKKDDTEESKKEDK